VALKTLVRNGVILHYKTGGASKGPNLMMVHGAGSNHTTWLNSASLLKGIRWVALDTRGHGCSGGVPDVYDTMADIMAIADNEGMRKFSVAGICMGGTLAVEAARRYPKRITDVVVISPFDKDLIRYSIFLKILCVGTCRICDHLPGRKRLELVDYRRPPPVPFFLTPLQDLLGISASNYGIAVLNTLKHNIYFNHLDIPMLVISGRRDTFLKKSRLKRRLENHPTASWVELDTNHHILTWKPRQVATLINNFIAGRKNR